MPTQTPRQALDKYAQGESPWSHDDLVDFVDEYSIERDVIANRPESGVYDDELFYATDERILYSWDDTNAVWEVALNQTRTPNLSISEWSQIDVVEAGLANDGSQDAGAFIESHAADDTLLLFPPGTYTFDTTAVLDGYENFGIKATSGGVNFTPGTLGDGDNLFTVGKTTVVKNFVIEGIDTDTASAALIDFKGDRHVFKDIEFTAERTTTQAQYHFSGFAPDPSDIVTFENVRMPLGGAFNTTASDSPGGVYIRQQHAGTIEFKDCEVGGFANNGIYASAPGLDTGANGRIIVEDGTYYNSNVACLRIGGDSSVIRNVDIRIDNAKTDFTALRGVYVRTGSSHVLDNISIEFSSAMSAKTAIQILPSADEVTLRDCSVVDEGSNEPLVIDDEDTTRATPVSVEGLEVTGSADNSSREYAVSVERDDTTFTNCSIIQPNRSAIQGLAKISVKESYIDAGNVPILVGGAGSKIVGSPVRVDAADVRLRDATVTSTTTNSLRLVQDGWSTNDGDPSVTGEWNTNGYEGVSVVDTTNGIAYHYINGSWQSISDLLDESFSPTWTSEHTFSDSPRILDDVYLLFGTNRDWGVRYNSTGGFEITRTPLASPEPIIDLKESGAPVLFYGQRFDFQNRWGNGEQSTYVSLLAGADTGDSYHRIWKKDTNQNNVLSLIFGWVDAANENRIANNDTALITFDSTGSRLTFPQGGNGAVNNEVASGVVTLSSGRARIDTGITTTPVNLDVFLDPSGNGANTVDVKASARVFWDGSVSTPSYKVEIVEDGTSVGNPDIGYKIVRGDQ